MGALAVVVAVVAVAVGPLLGQRDRTTDRLTKLRLATAMLALQFVLSSSSGYRRFEPVMRVRSRPEVDR